jgi:type III restriction enzyme
VSFYARNDHLGLLIPYELFGVTLNYEPDFLVRLVDWRTVVLEIKGHEPNEALAKHAAAKRWVSAVNNWAQLNRWEFRVCHDPQRLGVELAGWLATPLPESPPIPDARPH